MGRGRAGAGDPDPEYQPLTGDRAAFNYRREPKDRGWAYAWALAFSGALAGGIYALLHRNQKFTTLYNSDYLNDPAHCPVHPHDRRLGEEEGKDFNPQYFLEASGLCLGVSAIGSVLLGLLLLLAFKSRPHGMVGFCAGLQVALPLSVGITALVQGSAGGSLPFFFMAGMLALVYWLYREQLVLVGRLLSQSVRALSALPSMVVAAIGLQFVGILVSLPLAASLFAAYTNGSVGPNPRVAQRAEGQCVDAEGNAVMCCAWVTEPWVPWYLAFGGIVLTWTSLLVFTIKLFTISGATAQWYFAPVGGARLEGATMRSLKFALGPNFGSLCLGSWVLTVIQYVRAALENIRQQAAENGGGLLVACLAGCLDMLYALFQQLTKFSIVTMAITGDGFWESCRTAFDLLTRNLLNTVGVWWFPGMILNTTAFLLSAAWGLLAFGGSYAYWGRDDLAMQSGAVLGGVAFVTSLLTLSFINSILLNIVDALYICWAMDIDAHSTTDPYIHEVFSSLPSVKVGAVVENPDGNLAYGAPGATTGPMPPQPYPQPQQAYFTPPHGQRV